jgi:ornithine carbamoyltransferase
LVKTNLEGRDFISIHDFSAEEIHTLLDQSFELKLELARGERHELLYGKTLAMIFERLSTRTRVSFETAMTQLGGHAQYLFAQTMQAAEGEPWKDAARVLSRYTDGIIIRPVHHSTCLEVAEYADVPVINASSSLGHPCQAMADMMTIKEKKGRFEGVKQALIWGFSSVKKPYSSIYSSIEAGAKLGMETVLAIPEGYEPDEKVINAAREDARATGGKIELTHDLLKAVEQADVVRPKGFVPNEIYENPEKKAPHQLKPEEYRSWKLDSKLLDRAKKDAIVMHALPAIRGEEITDDVIEGKHSVVFDQAENRLHVQKAILASIMS